MRGPRLRRGPTALAAALCATLAAAQETQAPEPAPQTAPPAAPEGRSGQTTIEVPSPILTLDQERLFADSAWGRRAQAETDAAFAALAAENRRIEADLTAEERDLTERRPSMDPEAFRAEADAFDARVVEIRRAQDAKERDLVRLRDGERARFFNAALPIFGEVLRDRGAVAILDHRAIFVAADAIDVTAEMLERIDARLGDGSGQPPAPEEPEGEPAPQEGGE